MPVTRFGRVSAHLPTGKALRSQAAPACQGSYQFKQEGSPPATVRARQVTRGGEAPMVAAVQALTRLHSTMQTAEQAARNGDHGVSYMVVSNWLRQLAPVIESLRA